MAAHVARSSSAGCVAAPLTVDDAGIASLDGSFSR
jgi:hypothetical protein